MALCHGALSTMSELSELEEGQMANLQTFGQVNQEMQESISKGVKRNGQLKIFLQQNREELKIRKAELEKEYERKEHFIQNKLNEITAETTEMTKAEGFYRAIEEFVVAAFRAMKTAQESPAAQMLNWNQSLDPGPHARRD